MTSLGFDIGSAVFATGEQDKIHFDNTPCIVKSIQKYGNNGHTIQLEFDRIDTRSDLYEHQSSRRMTWYVYHPKKVLVTGMHTNYDPNQQPFEDSDI